MLGTFAAGRIVNPLTARSQLTGGMIWGLSMALHEEAVRDQSSAHLHVVEEREHLREHPHARRDVGVGQIPLDLTEQGVLARQYGGDGGPALIGQPDQGRPLMGRVRRDLDQLPCRGVIDHALDELPAQRLCAAHLRNRHGPVVAEQVQYGPHADGRPLDRCGLFDLALYAAVQGPDEVEHLREPVGEVVGCEGRFGIGHPTRMTPWLPIPCQRWHLGCHD